MKDEFDKIDNIGICHPLSAKDREVKIALTPAKASTSARPFAGVSSVAVLALAPKYRYSTKEANYLACKMNEIVNKSLQYGKRSGKNVELPIRLTNEFFNEYRGNESREIVLCAANLLADSISNVDRKLYYEDYLEILDVEDTAENEERIFKAMVSIVSPVNPVDLTQFHPDKVLGKGAYGSVYKWNNLAVKVVSKIHPEWEDISGFMAVMNEVCVYRALSNGSPYTLKCFGLDYIRDEFLICTELCEHMLWAEPAFTDDLLMSLLKGLSYMHDCDIVHGDIKPDNILVRSDGTLAIADFGGSTLYASQAAFAFVGTIEYLPREVIDYKVELYKMIRKVYPPYEKMSKTVDVWAVGVTILSMRVGKPYFRGETESQLLQSVDNYLQTRDPETLLGKLLNPVYSERITIREALELLTK